MSLLKNAGFSSDEAALFLQLLSVSNSKESQVAASLYFRKKLSACQEPPQSLVERIIVELISCLDRPIADVQLNASWALTNLACGSRQDTHRIVSNGGIHALLRQVKRSKGELRDQSVWALGNLAADCRICREHVRQSGLMPHLLLCLESPSHKNLEQRKIVIWCLVNLVRGGMNGIAFGDVKRLFDSLRDTIEAFEETEEIVCDAIWTLAYLIDHAPMDAERINVAFETPGLVSKMVSFLKSNSNRVLAGSLRAVGNIITGTDEQTTRILDMDVLSHLTPLLEAPEEQIARETLWILSNIAAGTEEHIAALLRIRGMAEKVLLLSRDVNSRKRKEAYWIVVNALMGASEMTYHYLLSGGAGHVLAQVLEEDSDFALTERALLAIQRVSGLERFVSLPLASPTLQALRDRPIRLAYTRAIFERVGVLSELRMLAVRDAEADVDSMAFLILQQHYGVETLDEVREQLEEEERAANSKKKSPVYIRINRRI